MKNTLKIVLLVFALVGFSFGQAATTSTTLSTAVTSTSQQQIVVASATGFAANTTQMYVGRELMAVNAVNGTTISVTRGAGGTRATTHVSGATVYVGPPTYFISFPKTGSCTATNEPNLPQLQTNFNVGLLGNRFDCFGGAWYADLNLGLYTLTIAPGARRSGSSPSAGNVISLTAQAGGASTAAGTAGGAGGASTLAGGIGGAGASTGTAGAGGALTIAAGAGGAAAGAGGVGGAGGAVAIAGGASGGTITSGAGGAVSITGGASANGSTAAGNGGNVTLRGGNIGTGGTGVVGKVQIAGAVDATKLLIIDPAGATTATATTLNVSQSAARTLTAPDATGGLPVVISCGSTGSGNQTCSPAAATVKTQIVNGTSTLASNNAVITFATAFTSTTSYFCVANDITTRANPVQMLSTSAGTATITNTTGASDVIQWICVGN